MENFIVKLGRGGEVEVEVSNFLRCLSIIN